MAGVPKNGVSYPLSVPQKILTFDTNVAPNTDFGETSLFTGLPNGHSNAPKMFFQGNK
jgi:hypothetical protein